MPVYIHKPDLDTCLTALVLGLELENGVIVLPGPAPESLLADPDAICIEVGGSGQVELNNFDHHDGERYFSPACQQAYELRYRDAPDPVLTRLVDYVCLVDDSPVDPPEIPWPSLAALFSGLRLVVSEPRLQFKRGVELLAEVWTKSYDPFAAMPDLPQWHSYLVAKEENRRRLEAVGVAERITFFTTASGLSAGLLVLTGSENGLIVGPGVLYREGCEIAVVFSPAFGTPPVRKFTIAGRNRRVSHLLPRLNRLEPGWGGRERIIGSPLAGGSKLSIEAVIEEVRSYV